MILDMRGSVRRLGAALAALLLCALLSSCATNQAFGIDLKAPSTSEEVRALALKAHGGDKPAQLELGKRFEAGRGIPKDLDRAAPLYAAAASPGDGSSIRTFYSPSGGVSTTVLNGGGAGGGLPYAAVRGCALKGAAIGAGKSCDALAGVGELLIFISYETNFWACADTVGFALHNPNPYRDVQKCLVAKAETIPCDGGLIRPLLRAEGLAGLHVRFANLKDAVRNLRAFCALRSPKSSTQVDEVLAQGEKLTPTDAVIGASRGLRPPYYRSYTADTFMVIMCRLTPRERALDLSDLEQNMCAVEVPRGES